MNNNIRNAVNAVFLAKSESGFWCGDDKHNEQVVFANGVFTVASNGDAQDFTNAADAVQALVNEWENEDTK